MLRSTSSVLQYGLSFLGCSLVFLPSASGQVFDVGPSDPALFDTVINVPADQPSISGSVGGNASTTQLNLAGGGAIGDSFDANSGSEVNISGGTVGFNFNANSGSEVNISGGTYSLFRASDGSIVNISGGFSTEVFGALAGSVVNISGGASSNRFTAAPGSDVELIGGDFQLNATAFTDSTITLTADDVFTGTLADGSVFIFSSNVAIFSSDVAADSDILTDVTLTTVGLPALDLTPIIVNTANPNLPSGLRAGQSLTLQDGGELGDNFEIVNALSTLRGGLWERMLGRLTAL